MTRIDKNSFLQRLVSQAATAKPARKAVDTGPGAGTYSLSFDERVAAGLAAIDPASTSSTDKALEVYINAALLETFGAELLNDPAYAHLLSDVLEGIKLSPDYPSFTQFVRSELNHVKR